MERNNFQVLPAIAGSGTDQAVVIPRGRSLVLRANGEVEIRETAGAADYFAWPADLPSLPLAGLGQTLYLRAAAGVTIRLALV